MVRVFFFLLFFLPVFAQGQVVINEIAWMGDGESYTNEWIELAGEAGTNLSGWTLVAEESDGSDGSPYIEIETTIPSSGFLVLERGAEKDYTGSLNNSGEMLVLYDADGNEIHRVDGADEWKINGASQTVGDNDTKQTAQRTDAGWITADATKGAANSASAEPTREEDNESNTNGKEAPAYDSADNTESTLDQNGSVASSETRNITAVMKAPNTAIAGSEARFFGEAYGLNGDPLSGTDFLWVFGDGTTKRGKNVRHIFRYPGMYRTVLHVSSGRYSASDTHTVTVVFSPLSITEVKPGPNGFIEIYNDSEYDIDISRWAISNGSRAFYVPDDTIILSGVHLVFPSDVSSITFPENGTASLLYPNGSRADALSYEALMYAPTGRADDESIHLFDGEARIGIESPGNNRFVARQYSNVPEATVQQHDDSQSVAVKQNATGHMPQTSQESDDALDTDSDDAVFSSSSSPQTAAVHISTTYESVWFWFGIAVLLGIVSGGAVFLIRRHTS